MKEQIEEDNWTIGIDMKVIVLGKLARVMLYNMAGSQGYDSLHFVFFTNRWWCGC